MLTLCVFTYEASGLISNTRGKKTTNKTFSLLGTVTLRVIILLVMGDNDSSFSAYFEMTVESMCP